MGALKEHGRRGWWESDVFSRVDRLLASARRNTARAHPLAFTAAAACIYILAVLVLGDGLGISANYFVIVPVLAAALAYGTPGGLLAGLAGLPANLLLFGLLGHPEFSPASKPMAEVSGLVVGLSFGYLSDYFQKLDLEMGRRSTAEASLRRAVSDKEALLRELQHRVRNNLNVLGSLIRLHGSRASGDEAKRMLADLDGRVRAMALVHESLTRSGGGEESVAMDSYLRSIAAAVLESHSASDVELAFRSDEPEARLPPDVAVWLGLILNEMVTNALKHAWPESAESRKLAVALERATLPGQAGERIAGRGAVPYLRLSIRDDGRGFDAAMRGPSAPPPSSPTGKDGLGRSIVDAIAARLGGVASWSSSGGTSFELTFPDPRGVDAAGPGSA